MFYIIFTLLYALINWVVFSQVINGLDLSITLKNVLKVWFIIMTLSPAVSNYAGERAGLWAAVTFIWFGLIFYLFLGGMVILVLKLAGGAGWHRYLAWGWLALSALICLWGIFQARHLQLIHETVALNHNPGPTAELRLALISDVHLHSVETESRLDRLLTALEQTKFDMLISAGDLIESGIHHGSWKEIAARLAAIKPPLGKYAVNGNHEFYANMVAGRDISREFHTMAGFNLLENQVRSLPSGIHLVGIGDQDGGSIINAELGLLDQIKDQGPVVLIKHRPQVNPQAIGRFQLMLSGHTHNGQLWPFRYLVRSLFPYIHGMYDLGQGSRLYVSSGVGTWGPPVRVGAAPELVVIKLIIKSSAAQSG